MRQVEVFDNQSLGIAQLLSLVDQTLRFYLMLFKSHFLIVSLDKLFIKTLLNISVLHTQLFIQHRGIGFTLRLAAKLWLGQVYYDFALTVWVFLELHIARVGYFEQVMATLADYLSRLLAVQTLI